MEWLDLCTKRPETAPRLNVRSTPMTLVCMASAEQKLFKSCSWSDVYAIMHGYLPAKSANSEYVRTTPTVMTNIKDKIEVQQPREVYTTLTLDGSACAPRDLKQVQNAKFQQKKEPKPTNQKYLPRLLNFNLVFYISHNSGSGSDVFAVC
jgi:hypothetical protein